jgi:hypothetical protein
VRKDTDIAVQSVSKELCVWGVYLFESEKAEEERRTRVTKRGEGGPPTEMSQVWIWVFVGPLCAILLRARGPVRKHMAIFASQLDAFRFFVEPEPMWYPATPLVVPMRVIFTVRDRVKITLPNFLGRSPPRSTPTRVVYIRTPLWKVRQSVRSGLGYFCAFVIYMSRTGWFISVTRDDPCHLHADAAPDAGCSPSGCCSR